MTPLRRNFTSIKEALNLTRKVGSEFVIHYAMRNVPAKPGFGALGVRDIGIIDLYEQELQWAFDFLTREMGLQRPAFTPIEVYVFEISEMEEFDGDPSPRTFGEIRGDRQVYSLALTSRTNLPNPIAERAYLRAAAVHEAAHGVCFGQPKLGTIVDHWIWFAEGTAEWLALKRLRQTDPVDIQTFEFVLDWCDYPEIPLNKPDDWYSAALFVDYLERRFKHNLIADLWQSATPNIVDEPWQKILARTNSPDLFLEFSCQAYFLNDPNSGFHCPDIYRRFGPRAWQHSHPNADWPMGKFVPHKIRDFACHYFAIHPPPGIQRLDLEFRSDSEHIRASVAASTQDYCQIGPILPVSTGVTKLDTAQYVNLDHFVLTVTTEPRLSYPESSKQHQFRFRLA